MRILYLGTPEFAVAPLKRLIEENYNIVAVVTAPDKPAGRGQKLQMSAVKAFAIEHQLKVLQPEKLRDESFVSELKSLEIDLGIVVAFRMLPEKIWNLPKLGTFNLHASLLPQYRGAAPIHWAVIKGEKETGVTTFFLQHEIDTGEIILQEKVEIHEKDTTGTMYEKLMNIGAELVLKTVNLVEKGNYITQKQITNNIELKSAPKVFKEMAEIDCNESVERIFNLVRGMNPFPTAWIKLNENVYKIFEVEKEIIQHDLAIKSIVTDHKSYLKIACSNGFIHIKVLQAEGKRRMNIDEFLRGNSI